MLDLDFHLTEEGQSALSCLRNPVTSAPKKIFGILERPAFPPTFQQIHLKLALIGKSGVGKTSLVSLLSNYRQENQVPGETPGVRVTNVYWPAKVASEQKVLLFNLEFWDSGEASTKKYNHILPVCKQKASALLYLFSFTDKSSFEDIEAQLARRPTNPGCAVIVIGTKYGLSTDVQVSQADVARLETQQKLSHGVLRILYYQPGVQRNPNETSFALNFICQQLFSKD